MAKSSSTSASKATTSKKQKKMKKQAGEITRGKSHTQLLTQRKSLKAEISKLPQSMYLRTLLIIDIYILLLTHRHHITRM